MSLLFLIVLCSLASGCASVKVVEHDRSFTQAALQAGKLGLAGVTTPSEPNFDYGEVHIEKMLRESLQSHCPDLDLVPSDRLQSILGAETRQRLLDRFRESAVLNQDDVASLKILKDQMRYVLLIDIREDEASSWSGTSSHTTVSTRTDPKTGKEEVVSSDTEYEASRSASRSLRTVLVIYDLELQKSVWAAVGSGGQIASNRRTSSSWTPPFPSAPSAPSTFEVMEPIIRKATAKLPLR